MGTFGYFRVPYSLYNHTAPGFSSLSQSVCRGQNFDGQIIRRANSKAGSPSGLRTRLQHRICQQPVCDPQKGERDLLKPNDFKAKIDLKDDLSLLYSSNLERPSNVPQVSLEGYSVEIRMPPIWNSKCPQGLDQDSKTVDRPTPVKEARNSPNHLFGRFFLLMATTKETLSYHVTLTATLLEMLGFVMNYQKSQLGFHINLITLHTSTFI